MSEQYESHPSEHSNAAFCKGLLAGTLIGAGVGLLFAPRRGSELRARVSDSAAKTGQVISKSVDEWTEKSRSVFDRAAGAASQASDAVQHAAADATRTVDSALNVASERASDAARRAEYATGRA